MKQFIYNEFLKRLIEVNDETKTTAQHDRLVIEFNAWKQGVKDASGAQFNGDYYYIDMIDKGEMKERPMCCGVFLDWKSEEDS